MASQAADGAWWGWWRPAGSVDSGTGGVDSVDRLIKSYAKSVYITAKALTGNNGDVFDAIAAEASNISAQAAPDIKEVFALEERLIRNLPSDERRRLHWIYQEQFERLATQAELAACLTATAPGEGADGKMPEPDTLSLLHAIHRNYMNTIVREGALRDLKRWVQRSMFGAAIVFLALIVALLVSQSRAWLDEPVVAFLIGLLLLFFLGRLGASMSVVQRLQRAADRADKDFFFETVALCTGRRGISMALLSGSVFALLLYVVFAAGLGAHLGMSGGIFPEVGPNSAAATATQPNGQAAASGSDGAKPADRQDDNGVATRTETERTVPASDAELQRFVSRIIAAVATAQAHRIDLCDTAKADCMPAWVTEIGKHLGFRSYPDFFKMLLLAFIAGFAERLVPDAIDRLTRRQDSVVDAQTRRGSGSVRARTEHAT